MTEIRIPYSTEYKVLKIREQEIKAVLKAEEIKASCSEKTIVKNALENPVRSQRLSALASNEQNILIITSDHTRPVPSKITMPALLEEIRVGNPDANIKILIATGFHRLTTQNEIEKKFGSNIMTSEEIIVHDSRDINNMVYKGILPSGGELWLNSLIDWADLTIAEGFIEPHFFAGFSGGRKSILPGIASEKTVLANHCSEFIANVSSSTGILTNNPIHIDMIFAADRADLKFILNVTLDAEKNITGAFAGHPVGAHEKGCEFLRRSVQLRKVKADIVVTSNGGYPLDQNIYQSVKGMTAAQACVNDGGVIIIAAHCGDGHGGEAFYKWFNDHDKAEDIAKVISAIPRDKTQADQWEAQILARVLMKAKVIMVTEKKNAQLVQNMKMTYAESFDKAYEIARSYLGRAAESVIIPDGTSVIII